MLHFNNIVDNFKLPITKKKTNYILNNHKILTDSYQHNPYQKSACVDPFNKLNTSIGMSYNILCCI